MSTTCEIQLLFKECDEPITLRDRDLIKKIPIIVRAIEGETPDWETCDVKVSSPIDIPFPKEAGDFLFKHLRKYVAPDDQKDDVTVENYKEADQKTLEELKDIIELANFMECTGFMHCIGFIIAKKLDKKSIEEIAAYMGVECNPEANMFDEEDGWIHPPAEIFQNN